jgi:hypothetical protein
MDTDGVCRETTSSLTTGASASRVIASVSRGASSVRYLLEMPAVPVGDAVTIGAACPDELALTGYGYLLGYTDSSGAAVIEDTGDLRVGSAAPVDDDGFIGDRPPARIVLEVRNTGPANPPRVQDLAWLWVSCIQSRDRAWGQAAGRSADSSKTRVQRELRFGQ